MSFGDVSRRRRPETGSSCPCGRGREFGLCCGPILGGRDAETAEQLMRSRYTAFTLGDIAHLTRTWDPATRPDDLDADRGTRWLALTVVRAAGGRADDEGLVEFRARWRAGGMTGELHEVSRFRRLRGRWVYVDGIIEQTS